MRKRKWKQGIAVLTAAALVLTGITVPGSAGAKAKIRLNKKKVTIKVGGKVTLKLKNAKKKVTWKSSKKKVASVSAKGIVRGKSAGTAKITAKSNKKSYTMACMASPFAWIVATVLLIGLYFYVMKDMKKKLCL